VVAENKRKRRQLEAAMYESSSEKESGERIEAYVELILNEILKLQQSVEELQDLSVSLVEALPTIVVGTKRMERNHKRRRQRNPYRHCFGINYTEEKSFPVDKKNHRKIFI